MKQDSRTAAWTRRRLIGSVGLVGAAALAAGKAPPRPRALGLQLYTLGDAPKVDFEGVLRQVAQIGYQTVELPGDYGRTPAELRRALDAAGLRCPAIHVVPQAMSGAWDLEGDMGVLADKVRTLGARRAVVAIAPLPERVRQVLFHPPEGGHDMKALDALFSSLTTDDWKRAAALLNARATRLARSGVGLAYHNHAFEFAPLAGGGTGYDLLISETDPALVSFEVDVGWVAAAGQDVARLVNRLGRRVSMMHLKEAAGVSPHLMEMTPADVGAGIVPWKTLADLIRRFDIEGLFVEQEPPFPGAPIASATAAFAYLSRLFAER